jgi:hypothetical protein
MAYTQEQIENLRGRVFDGLASAGKEILSLYDKHDAAWNAVADHLGINYVTLWRWVKRLGIEAKVETIRAKKAKIIRARDVENGRAGGKVGGWPLGKPRKKKRGRR